MRLVSVIFVIAMFIGFSAYSGTGEGDNGGGPNITSDHISIEDFIRGQDRDYLYPTHPILERMNKIHLRDGRSFGSLRDIKSFNSTGGVLNFIELQSGEVVDRLDIHSIHFHK